MAAKQECVQEAASVDHPLTAEEIDQRASSDTPFFKLVVEKKAELQTCYFSTEKHGLLYPPKKLQGNTAAVLKITRLVKQSGSDQHGYVISNVILEDTYLQVNDGSKKRVVSFTEPKQAEQPRMFHQNQLFKLRKHTKAEAKFALYTTVVDSKGHNKIYYLKPESGSIVSEESSTPDGYYCFSMIMGLVSDLRTQPSYPVLKVKTSATTSKYCYIGTHQKDLYYDPNPWGDTISSNQSVRIDVTELTNNKYVLSAIIIPNWYLTVRSPNSVQFSEPAVSSDPITSPERYHDGQKFTRTASGSNYAFSITKTTGTGDQTYYLKPSGDTCTRIGAEASTSPDDYYLFTIKTNTPWTLINPYLRGTGVPAESVLEVKTTSRNTTLCYIGTETKELYYDPNPWAGTIGSNQSVEMTETELELQNGTHRYVISSYIIPNFYLELKPRSMRVIFSEPAESSKRVTSPSRYKFFQKFVKWSRSNSKFCAYSQKKDGKTYFMKPTREKITFEESETPIGYYLFRFGSRPLNGTDPHYEDEEDDDWNTGSDEDDLTEYGGPQQADDTLQESP